MRAFVSEFVRVSVGVCECVCRSVRESVCVCLSVSCLCSAEVVNACNSAITLPIRQFCLIS